MTDTDGNSIRVVDGPGLVSMSIKGGALSCGREKVLGLAFEDLGRSRLGKVDLDLGETRRLGDSNTPIPIPWWQGRDVAGLGGRTESVRLRWHWEDLPNDVGSVRRGRSIVKG